MSETIDTRRVADLEKRLADLLARLPAHSIPPSMLARLDELEEALEQARREARQRSTRTRRP
jgi:hypothetical protein